MFASEAQTLHNLKNRTDDVNNYLILIGNRAEDERRWQANIGDERGLLMLMALNCVCEIQGILFRSFDEISIFEIALERVFTMLQT